MANPMDSNISGIKVAVGSGSAVFLISAVFWAGATYNRVSGIEDRLRSIETQLEKISDLPNLTERSLENEKRIEKLEDSVRQLH